MPLVIRHNDFEIVVSAESTCEPRYNPLSVDNSIQRVDESFFGDDNHRDSSRHRVVVKRGNDVLVTRLLLANGGASGVHAHSAFLHDDTCFVAIGPFVCALAIPSLQVLWHTRADQATCFGVYDAPMQKGIISHGEIEIARLTYEGKLLWSTSGRDIFSEGFSLFENHAEAIDFHGTRYRFNLETGRSDLISSS